MKSFTVIVTFAVFFIAIGNLVNASAISNNTQQHYGKIPLYFVENRGQLDKRVSYYVPGKNETLYFRKSVV